MPSKIILVGAFPPSGQGLNEYNYVLAGSLAKAGHSVTVLASELTQAEAQKPFSPPQGVVVRRVWKFNTFSSVFKILSHVKKEKPDITLFCMLFSTFGFSPVKAFVNMFTPLLCRLSGFKTGVLLHHIIEQMDLDKYAAKNPAVLQFGLRLATRLLLLSHKVIVFVNGYKKILEEKYRVGNVAYVPHGSFTPVDIMPELNRNAKNILIMGKFGAYKRLDYALDLLLPLCREDAGVRLVVAGQDHPRFQGHISAALSARPWPFITYRGYVPDEKLPELFAETNVAVIPYHFLTGTSGMVHLAVNYGRPVVAFSFLEIEDMVENEGIAIETAPYGAENEFREKVRRILNNPDIQAAMGVNNFNAGKRLSPDNTAAQIVRCMAA